MFPLRNNFDLACRFLVLLQRCLSLAVNRCNLDSCFTYILFSGSNRTQRSLFVSIFSSTSQLNCQRVLMIPRQPSLEESDS